MRLVAIVSNVCWLESKSYYASERPTGRRLTFSTGWTKKLENKYSKNDVIKGDFSMNESQQTEFAYEVTQTSKICHF